MKSAKFSLAIAVLFTTVLFTACSEDKKDEPIVETPDQTPPPPTPELTYSYSKIASVTALARLMPATFVVNGIAYLGLGEPNGGAFYSDFYKYNPATNTWTQLNNFPGVARRGPVCFVINNIAYLGLGSAGNSGMYYDFWKYNVASDTWTQLNNFPFSDSYLDGISTFVINSKAYIVGEFVYEYNPTNDTWTKVANVPEYGYLISDAVSFVINGKGYACTGRKSFGDPDKKAVWEFNPSGYTWTKKADFAGTARSLASGFVLGNYGYLVGGNSTNQTWRYDPTTDTWKQLADFPEWGHQMGCFVIGNNAYLGVGWKRTSLSIYTPASVSSSFYKLTIQ